MWAKSNNKTRGQFKCGVTWLCFFFDFVRSHVRYYLERRVCLKLHVQGQGGGIILDVDGEVGGRS